MDEEGATIICEHIRKNKANYGETIYDVYYGVMATEDKNIINNYWKKQTYVGSVARGSKVKKGY